MVLGMAGGRGNRCFRICQSLGHEAHAPTLDGHGPGHMRRAVEHQHCVRSVIDYIQKHELQDIVLVGQSFGGTVVQKLAAEIPDTPENSRKELLKPAQIEC